MIRLDYECKNGHVTEIVVQNKAPKMIKCPKCAYKAIRQIPKVSIIVPFDFNPLPDKVGDMILGEVGSPARKECAEKIRKGIYEFDKSGDYNE